MTAEACSCSSHCFCHLRREIPIDSFGAFGDLFASIVQGDGGEFEPKMVAFSLIDHCSSVRQLILELNCSFSLLAGLWVGPANSEWNPAKVPRRLQCQLRC